METQKFKPGDVVRLIADGPKMTVSGYDDREPHIVRCVWFDESADGTWGALRSNGFVESTLMGA